MNILKNGQQRRSTVATRAFNSKEPGGLSADPQDTLNARSPRETPFRPFDPAKLSDLKANRKALESQATQTVNGAFPPLGPERQWCDEVLYFAMTDRFENGDKSNDGNIDPEDPERFHGGDWKGITNKLDDLKDLGVTALWISPTTKNDRDFFGKDGFHGYWPMDFKETEPGFGTMDELKELVSTAHDKGMKVLIDLVLNHTGYNHPWTKDPQTRAEKFHDPDLRFQDDMINGSLFGLPDLAQERPEVADGLIDMAKFWARETGCDGFRLDAIMHLPSDFQKRFVAEMKEEFGDDFFVLGEAYTGPPSRLAEFQQNGDMDSVYDFSFSEAVRNVAGHNEDHNFITRWLEFRKLKDEFPGEAYRIKKSKPDARQLSELFAQDKVYDDPRSLVTLVENHDMPRFITAAGPEAKEKFKQALALEFTVRGIPLLYYGAEDGMGLQENDLRADKRHGDDPEMRDFVKTLAHLRHDSPALRRGVQKEIAAEKRFYAFSREAPGDTVLVAANFDDEDMEKTLPLPAAGLVWKEVLSGKIYEPDGSDLSIKLPARGTAVLRALTK